MTLLTQNPLEALRTLLPQSPPQGVGRDEFATFPEIHQGQSQPVRAAVLIPVVAHPEPTLLFTQRTEHLSKHSGQISFPGGRSEPGDASALETALRETREETGIDPALVRVAGYLPRYLTGTGFDISPVVGVVAPGFVLRPDTREVAEIFEVKLSYFLDPANARQISRDLGGRARRVHVYEPDGRNIWGITATLLFDFAGRLKAAHAKDSP